MHKQINVRPLTKCSSWRRSRTGPKANLLSCRPAARVCQCHEEVGQAGRCRRTSEQQSQEPYAIPDPHLVRCFCLQARLEELQAREAMLQREAEEKQHLHVKLEQAQERTVHCGL